MYYIVLYCVVLHCIVFYCIGLNNIVLHCIVLYCIILCCIILHCLVLYHIVLYYNAQYCIILHFNSFINGDKQFPIKKVNITHFHLFSVYSALLWLDRVRDVGWLFMIWSFAALFNHFVCRVFLKQSRLMIHYSLLGYSVTPLIPFSALIIIFHPPVWVCTVFEIIAVIWSSLAAFFSYLLIFNDVKEVKNRLILILPSVVLMEIYLLSLLPIRPPRFN